MPHGDGRGVLAEALVSWLSIYGAIAALRVYWVQTTRSRLELCVMFMLGCLATLLFVRGFFWITGAPLFGVLTFMAASVVPFAAFLYVEALLRRHLPLLAKAFVLAGTAFFFLLAAIGQLHASAIWLPVFTGYVIAAQAVLTGAIVFRDPAGLTPVENRAVGAVAVAIVMIVPLVVTDLLSDLGMNMVRVGSVGILMFVHGTVVASEPRGNARIVFFGHLAILALSTLLGAIEAYVIGDLRAATIARCGSLFAAILMLAAIHMRVRAHVPMARPGLVRGIASADTRTTESFLRVLEPLPIVAGYRLMRLSDLKGYDVWSFPDLFRARGTKIVTLSQLRRTERPRSGDAYHEEELESLLEREAMSHAVLIQELPLALLLVAIPSAGNEQAATAQLGMIRTVAEVIERSRPGD